MGFARSALPMMTGGMAGGHTGGFGPALLTGGMSSIPGMFQHGGGNGGGFFGQHNGQPQPYGDPHMNQQPPSNVPPGFLDAMHNTNPGYTAPPGTVFPPTGDPRTQQQMQAPQGPVGDPRMGQNYGPMLGQMMMNRR